MSVPLLQLAAHLLDEPESLFLNPAYPVSHKRLHDNPLSMISSEVASLGHTDIAETSNAYEFTVDVPGIAKEHIDITIKDKVLTIVGHRKRPLSNEGSEETSSEVSQDKKVENDSSPKDESVSASEGDKSSSSTCGKRKVRYLRSEIVYGDFTRSFTLPKDVDEEDLTARLENGVLHVRLGKKQAKKDDGIRRIRLE